MPIEAEIKDAHPGNKLCDFCTEKRVGWVGIVVHGRDSRDENQVLQWGNEWSIPVPPGPPYRDSYWDDNTYLHPYGCRPDSFTETLASHYLYLCREHLEAFFNRFELEMYYAAEEEGAPPHMLDLIKSRRAWDKRRMRKARKDLS